MRVHILEIENFCGIKKGRVELKRHTLLVGGNNIGKSTICNALELALGPERLYRRPVINEHDFWCGQYEDENGLCREIRIKVVLTELSESEQRDFCQHLRRWDPNDKKFIDEEPGGLTKVDDPSLKWGLPIIFIGKYDSEEDDFIGETFFDHPVPNPEELDEEEVTSLGAGRAVFTRKHKRNCGFVFLHTLRTGSRALSLQRGSLLDTILRLGTNEPAGMWKETLSSLCCLEPGIGDIEQLDIIQRGIQKRLRSFIGLAPGQATRFFASELTREHLREVVRLFVASQPSNHLVPFAKQGTGAVNLLVFSLLTIIAELKEGQSVIFVMEEPEIALPPHTQRRVTRYVLEKMGQSIITSHSPYVIEQHDPESVVTISRQDDNLEGMPLDAGSVKPKTYRTHRRQFAEAILSRAVLVVEGETEATVVNAVSSALERIRPSYSHIDLAGVSIFDANGDRNVPRFGPIFKSLGKSVYGLRDKLNSKDADNATNDLEKFDRFWQSPEVGIEQLLAKQIPESVLRSFLEEARQREDYPEGEKYAYAEGCDTSDIVVNVLKKRKGTNYGIGYAAMLIEKCKTEEDLPEFFRDALLEIDQMLSSSDELPDSSKLDISKSNEAEASS